MITQKELTIGSCVEFLIANISEVNGEMLSNIKLAYSSKPKTTITQKELKNKLRYDSSTGEFSRLSDGEIAGYMSNGYVRMTVNGSCYPAHRLAWLYVHGKFPKNQIDHINGIRKDNRIINLRDVTQAENTKNSKIASNNTSGFKGVEWIPSRNKWRALISSKGKKINVGSHYCKIDAVIAVIKARREYGFHENHGRA